MIMEKMTFRRAIHEAIRESDLNIRQKLKLNVVLLIPGAKKKIEEHILNEAKNAQIVNDTLTLDSNAQLDIDWDKVKEFIKTYLPILIKLLIAILL